MSAENAMECAVDGRTVPAVFGRTQVVEDPVWEWQYASSLKDTYLPSELAAIYSRYRGDEGVFEIQLRRIVFRAMCKRAGHGLRVEPEVIVKHPETIELGDSVFVGAHTMIQGRFDGTCRIGNHVWIGCGWLRFDRAYFEGLALRRPAVHAVASVRGPGAEVPWQ